MSAKGPQWALQELRVTEVRTRNDFQLRAGGLSRAHVSKLRRLLEDGRDLEPVKVARIGEALYLVDGYHRLAAHEAAKRETVRANVARMSLARAKEVAKLANTTHGLPLSRKDKEGIWLAHVEAGEHLDETGRLKSLRTIEADLNYTVTREYVRGRLRKMGMEDQLDPVKPWERDVVDEETLAEERLEEAERSLRDFADTFPTLAAATRGPLLKAARDMLDALEAGETPEMVVPMAERLGI